MSGFSPVRQDTSGKFGCPVLSGLDTHMSSPVEPYYTGSKNPVQIDRGIGLDRTGHMSFLTGQDRTPKFAGQVLPDRTESGLIFLNILPYK